MKSGLPGHKSNRIKAINSDSSQATELAQAFDLSERILSALDAGDLDQVNALYAERESTLKNLYRSNTVDASDTQKLLELNNQVIARLQQLKDKTQQQQVDIKQGAKATKAYLDNI